MSSRPDYRHMTDQFVRSTDPDAVFSLLADETRIAILQSLWDADDGATFSELREAVGTGDSGRFNYHLDKLVGQFVKRTEEGYRLTQAGKRINGVITSGTYTVRGTVDPITLEEPCRVCGGTRTLRYEDEAVRVECDSCPAKNEATVPPAVFAGHDREAIPRVASRYLRTTFRQISDGFCWYCTGRTRPTIAPLPEIDAADVRPEDLPGEFADRLREIPWVEYDCQRCGASSSIGLDHIFLDHPAVVEFYYDRGVDVRDRLMWAFPPLTADCMEIRSRNPLRASVTYSLDGDAITVVVDDRLDVVAIEP